MPDSSQQSRPQSGVRTLHWSTRAVILMALAFNMVPASGAVLVSRGGCIGMGLGEAALAAALLRAPEASDSDASSRRWSGRSASASRSAARRETDGVPRGMARGGSVWPQAPPTAG